MAMSVEVDDLQIHVKTMANLNSHFVVRSDGGGSLECVVLLPSFYLLNI